ncbi:MAG: hypothetical protein ACYTG6_15845, partial [Planctomycetota bacterium]
MKPGSVVCSAIAWCLLLLLPLLGAACGTSTTAIPLDGGTPAPDPVPMGPECVEPDLDRITLSPNSVDFMVDALELTDSWRLSDEDFAADDCAIVEGLIPEPGLRRLLRFSTHILNMGDRDA